MRLSSLYFHAKYLTLIVNIALLASFSPRAIALDMRLAEQQVKALPCKDEKTVGQVLDASVRRRSQRDLGWRTFEDEGYYDIERAVLINKGMELRYRWRVFMDGNIEAYSERAEKLCRSGDD
ncbi:hypothetical protein [Methylomonas sp. MgM2]